MLELLYLQTWHHLIPGMALGLQGVVWGPPPPQLPPKYKPVQLRDII